MEAKIKKDNNHYTKEEEKSHHSKWQKHDRDSRYVCRRGRLLWGICRTVEEKRNSAQYTQESFRPTNNLLRTNILWSLHMCSPEKCLVGSKMVSALINER